jgi:voltage-dependent calcium channel alpha-2/delta-3
LCARIDKNPISDLNISLIIHRSRHIDKTFLKNYQDEPTMGWQYFCNSSGMFRHFPATNWSFYPMNTYDCRMRPWFTNAASSSKDIVVLLEQSGSMMGSRLGIAIDVVRNILDTLTINDYVNVFSFNDSFRAIIDCKDGFTENQLVQATSANIFDLKQALNNVKAGGQTDLAEALNHTLKLLQSSRDGSAHCNQVIMLITDGMEYNETIREVFKKQNWDKNNDVRVFSYLIGEMIPEHDYEQVKLMACENRGYYVQIDTKMETREQVLKYIPVMARPMAYNKTQNPVIWSTVYADLLDSHRITNYDWDCLQKDTQRQRVVHYLRTYQYYPCITDNDDKDDRSPYRKYVFMTTVAMPAFEQDKNSVMTT